MTKVLALLRGGPLCERVTRTGCLHVASKAEAGSAPGSGPRASVLGPEPRSSSEFLPAQASW